MLHAIGCKYCTKALVDAAGKLKRQRQWRQGIALVLDPRMSDVKVIIDLETAKPVPYKDLYTYNLDPYMGIVRPDAIP